MTAEQLLATTPAGRNSDPDLNLTGVGLGVGLHSVGMHQDFTATAHRDARRRRDHWEVREAQFHDSILTALDTGLHLRPGGKVGGKQGDTKVCSDGEVTAFVVDHQCLPRFILVDQRDGFVEHCHHAIVERIGIGGKLETQNAVAEIPDRRRTAAQHRLGPALDVGEQQHALGSHDSLIAAVAEHEEALPVFHLIEGTVADLLEQGWHAAACLGELARDPCRADNVHQLERTPLEAVASLHRLIYVEDGMRDVERVLGSVDEVLGHIGPSRIGEGVTGLKDCSSAFLRHRQRCTFGRLDRAVFAGFQVADFLDLLAAFTVDAVPAALALPAGVTLGNHLIEQLGLAVFLAEQIALIDVVVERFGDVGPQIQPNQIHQLEDAGRGEAEVAPSEGVGLLNAQPVISRSVRCRLQQQRAQTIGDKAGCVLTIDHLFAQRHVADSAQLIDHVCVGRIRRDQLKKLHVARWVKEVGDGKALGAGRVHAVGQDRQRDG